MTTRQNPADLLLQERVRQHAALASYDAFHDKRFKVVLETARRVCPDPSAHVLDIGRSVLTGKLLGYYNNVSTLGFALHETISMAVDTPDGTPKTIRSHLVYDLNDAQTLAPVPSDDRFDLIVFAEVIEHLFTAPELVLGVLKGLMKPGGHMILQTPNAAALHKRLLLLAGFNPYEKIRLDRTNPGHFREYTKRELLDYARRVQLDVVSHMFKDYFGTDVPSWPYLYLQKGLAVFVPSFARGQTLVLRNPI